MSDISPESPEGQWPAVPMAFGFVIPSYQMLLSRFEAADTRITALVTVSSGIMLAAPAIGKAVDPSLQTDGPFLLGLLWFSVALTVGVYGRSTGKITLPNPAVLYRETLHETGWEFQKNAIHYAGKHFDKNKVEIERKSYFSIAVMVLTMFQVASLSWWVAR